MGIPVLHTKLSWQLVGIELEGVTDCLRLNHVYPLWSRTAPLSYVSQCASP